MSRLPPPLYCQQAIADADAILPRRRFRATAGAARFNNVTAVSFELFRYLRYSPFNLYFDALLNSRFAD
jgi:hypothetical protein